MRLKLEDGKLVQSWDNVQQQKAYGEVGGFACRSLCGKSLRRPHFTCLFCRLRRAYYGKMSNKIEVTAYLLLIRRDRRFAKVKAVVLKRLLAICEWLAN